MGKTQSVMGVERAQVAGGAVVEVARGLGSRWSTQLPVFRLPIRLCDLLPTRLCALTSSFCDRFASPAGHVAGALLTEDAGSGDGLDDCEGALRGHALVGERIQAAAVVTPRALCITVSAQSHLTEPVAACLRSARITETCLTETCLLESCLAVHHDHV